MFSTKDAPAQLIYFSAALSAIRDRVTDYAACCSIRVRIRVGIVGSLVHILDKGGR